MLLPPLKIRLLHRTLAPKSDHLAFTAHRSGDVSLLLPSMGSTIASPLLAEHGLVAQRSDVCSHECKADRIIVMWRGQPSRRHFPDGCVAHVAAPGTPLCSEASAPRAPILSCRWRHGRVRYRAAMCLGGGGAHLGAATSSFHPPTTPLSPVCSLSAQWGSARRRLSNGFTDGPSAGGGPWVRRGASAGGRA